MTPHEPTPGDKPAEDFKPAVNPSELETTEDDFGVSDEEIEALLIDGNNVNKIKEKLKNDLEHSDRPARENLILLAEMDKRLAKIYNALNAQDIPYSDPATRHKRAKGFENVLGMHALDEALRMAAAESGAADDEFASFRHMGELEDEDTN